ncbi:hypothetical protein GA0115253_108204, partial [Streptomyces sp. Termitarium-T10T-6]
MSRRTEEIPQNEQKQSEPEQNEHGPAAGRPDGPAKPSSE